MEELVYKLTIFDPTPSIREWGATENPTLVRHVHGLTRARVVAGHGSEFRSSPTEPVNRRVNPTRPARFSIFKKKKEKRKEKEEEH